MPWIACIRAVRETKSHTLASQDEPGRHRRGEIVLLDRVEAIPEPGTLLLNGTFTHIFLTDIPDGRDEEQLRKRLTREHRSETYGIAHLSNVTTPFQVNDIVTGSNSNTEGKVTEVHESYLVLDEVTDDWEFGEPISSPNGSAVLDEFEGEMMGRKVVFISVSELAAPRRRRAWAKEDSLYQGWDDVDFQIFEDNWIKRRKKDDVPIGRGNPADDDVDDANGRSKPESKGKGKKKKGRG